MILGLWVKNLWKILHFFLVQNYPEWIWHNTDTLNVTFAELIPFWYLHEGFVFLIFRSIFIYEQNALLLKNAEVLCLFECV